MRTALRVVASPLGLPPLGFDATGTFEAVDGIRTHDPHAAGDALPAAHPRNELESSPGAKHDDSQVSRPHTNLLVRCGWLSRLCEEAHVDCCDDVFARCNLRPRSSPRRRSRGSVESIPLHTRRVAGSISQDH